MTEDEPCWGNELSCFYKFCEYFKLDSFSWQDNVAKVTAWLLLQSVTFDLKLQNSRKSQAGRNPA